MCNHTDGLSLSIFIGTIISLFLSLFPCFLVSWFVYVLLCSFVYLYISSFFLVFHFPGKKFCALFYSLEAKVNELKLCTEFAELDFLSQRQQHIYRVGQKVSPSDLSNQYIASYVKSTVILHVHQLGNDSILYQVVCAVCSIKYSMVLSSR